MIWACPSHTTALPIFVNIFISLFKNDKKCRLNISYGCGVFGSGCSGLRFRFGNPFASLRAVPAASEASRRPPHPSRELTPFPSLFQKRGAMQIIPFTIVPPL